MSEQIREIQRLRAAVRELEEEVELLRELHDDHHDLDDLREYVEVLRGKTVIW